MAPSPLLVPLASFVLLTASPETLTERTGHADSSQFQTSSRAQKPLAATQAPPPKESVQERKMDGSPELQGRDKCQTTPLILDKFQTAQKLCRDLKELREMTFEVVVPEPTSEKMPRGKAAQKRWNERRKESLERLQAAELKRLQDDYERQRESKKSETWASVLSWREFADLLEVIAHEEEEVFEYEVWVNPTEADSFQMASKNTAQVPLDQVCEDSRLKQSVTIESVAELHRKKRRTTKIDAVEISLGRVFTLFDGRMKLFDLDKSSLTLVPTSDGHRDAALQQALQRGALTLKLIWSPAHLEKAPCAEGQTGILSLSADFLGAELISQDATLALFTPTRDASLSNRANCDTADPVEKNEKEANTVTSLLEQIPQNAEAAPILQVPTAPKP